MQVGEPVAGVCQGEQGDGDEEDAHQGGKDAHPRARVVHAHGHKAGIYDDGEGADKRLPHAPEDVRGLRGCGLRGAAFRGRAHKGRVQGGDVCDVRGGCRRRLVVWHGRRRGKRRGREAFCGERRGWCRRARGCGVLRSGRVGARIDARAGGEVLVSLRGLEGGLQVGAHLAGALVARRRVEARGLLHDGGDARRHLAGPRPASRFASRQHEAHDHAQRVDVGARVGLSEPVLLGGGVARCAQQARVAYGIVAVHPRDPQIHEHGDLAVCDDVARVDVAVHDWGIGGLVQGA